MPERSQRLIETCLALSVGVVLADSSIVTLALPSVLSEFDTTVFGVSWVLTSFNLVLALGILPAVRLARTHPQAGWCLGLVTFAAASLICGVAGSIALLIGGRIVQAIGGALIIACAIEALARSVGSHERAAPIWGSAATIGIAVGPALGGLLTELLSWQSIFLLQVPLILLAPVAARARLEPPEAGPSGAPDLRPEVALALISAGLTGALFLLVVLLTEGWGETPIAAAAIVSAIPLATAAARWISSKIGPPSSAALAGCIAIAGGLAALGVLPGAHWALTLQPQLLIGAGLALALPVLTLAALSGRDPDGSRAASTIAARHAGIVLGILLLAPLLSAQLTAQQRSGIQATTALLLDAPVSPETKIDLGAALAARYEAADGRRPDLDEAFGELTADEGEATAISKLRTAVNEQVERAATTAFRWPFIGAALLAALALIPIARLRNATAGTES